MKYSRPVFWALHYSMGLETRKWGLQVEERGSVGPDEEDEHADHGRVAHQRQEMELRHLEQTPRRRRGREDGRRRFLVPPQDDVRRCNHQPKKHTSFQLRASVGPTPPVQSFRAQAMRLGTSPATQRRVERPLPAEEPGPAVSVHRRCHLWVIL